MSHLWDKDLAIASGAITGRAYAKDTFSSSLVFPPASRHPFTFPAKLDSYIIDSNDFAFALVQVDITSALVKTSYLDLVSILFSFESHQLLFKVALSPVQAVLVHPIHVHVVNEVPKQ